MAYRARVLPNGETRSDLIFIRLSPTEKVHLRELVSEHGEESMSAFIRWMLNTYYEVSRSKAS